MCQDLIEPVVEAMGYELVGTEFVEQDGNRLLRVYIDKEGGITLDDCEKVSHQVSGLLDVEDPIPGQYSLEISSPGLDRPLFKERDFERFAGHKVKIKLDGLYQGRRRITGVLHGMSEGQVVVVEEQGEEHLVPLDRIKQARLVPDF
jgi:ribosome maturation factor RimP